MPSQSKQAFFFNARKSQRKERGRPAKTSPPPYEDVAGMQGPTSAPHDHTGDEPSFDMGDRNGDFGREDSIWRHARLSNVTRPRGLRFVELQNGTDLNVPPPHYLRLEAEAFVHRQAPGYVRDRDRAMGCLLDAALKLERPSGAPERRTAGPVVAAGEEALRRITEAVAFGFPLALDVHRVGDIAVLDASASDDVRPVSSPHGHHQKALAAKMLYKLADPALQHSIAADRPHQRAAAGSQVVRRDANTLPTVSALSTTSLTGNAGEKEHQYANVLRWQLGDADLLLGVDRPVLTDASGSFFPLVLADIDAIHDPMVARDTLFAWTVARLTRAPRVVTCFHERGRVVQYTPVPMSDIHDRVFGSMRAGECLQIVLRVMKWIADSAGQVGVSYRVRHAPGSRTLVLRSGCGISQELGATSLPWEALYDDRETVRRHRSAVGLLFLTGAAKLGSVKGDRMTHSALTMLLRGLEDLLTSIHDTHWLRQGALRQQQWGRGKRLAHLLDAPEEVELLRAIIRDVPDLCASLIEAGSSSLGTSGAVASEWVCSFVSTAIRALVRAAAVKRDLPPLFVNSNSPAAEEIQSASDSLQRSHHAVCLNLAFVAASASSRIAAAAVSAIRSMAPDCTAPFELAAIGKTAIICLAAMEAVIVAASPSLNTASDAATTKSTTVALSGHDAGLEAKAVAAADAIREHTSDLLTATLPDRRGVSQILAAAADRFLASTSEGVFGLDASDGLRHRFKHVNQLVELLHVPDPNAVCYAALRMLTQRPGTEAAACSRIETKRARIHLALGTFHRTNGRITKALDSLLYSSDLVQVASGLRDARTDDFTVAEDGMHVDELRAQVNLELATLYRTRALFERKSGYFERELEALGRAINGLKEEVKRQEGLTPDSSAGTVGPKRSLECRTALGAINAIHASRLLARLEDGVASAPEGRPRGAHQFEDLFDQFCESEALAGLPKPAMLAFKMRVVLLALRSLTLRAGMDAIPQVLASRQAWGIRAWELLSATGPDPAPRGLPEARVAWPEVADEELRSAMVVSPADAVSHRVALIHCLCDYDLFLEGPNPGAPLPRAAEAARAVIELVRCAGAADVSPLPCWKLLRVAILKLSRKADGDEINRKLRTLLEKLLSTELDSSGAPADPRGVEAAASGVLRTF